VGWQGVVRRRGWCLGKSYNAVHRAFWLEPFGNGRIGQTRGHMALLQVAYSARTAARLDA